MKADVIKYWQSVIEKCDNRPIGMTITDWLERNDIKIARYYYWKKRIQGVPDSRGVNGTRAYWTGVVDDYENRPAGVRGIDWLQSNGVDATTFFFWKRKLIVYKKQDDRTEQKWRKIVDACNNRPEDQSVYSWLKENNVQKSQYYYWVKKFKTCGEENLYERSK